MTTLMRLTQFATTAKGKFADIQRSAHRTANLACECTEYVVRMSNWVRPTKEEIRFSWQSFVFVPWVCVWILNWLRNFVVCSSVMPSFQWAEKEITICRATKSIYVYLYDFVFIQCEPHEWHKRNSIHSDRKFANHMHEQVCSTHVHIAATNRRIGVNRQVSFFEMVSCMMHWTWCSMRVVIATQIKSLTVSLTLFLIVFFSFVSGIRRYN